LSRNDRQSSEPAVVAGTGQPVASQPAHSQAVVVQQLASPPLASRLVGTQRVGSFVVIQHPPFVGTQQPAESPPLASQPEAPQHATSQPASLATPRPSASDPTVSQPVVLGPAPASQSFDGDGAVAPDELPPEAFLGRWVRDGGKTHVVVSVPGPAGSFLEFRPTDGFRVAKSKTIDGSQVPGGVPILRENGQWRLNSFRLTAAFRVAAESCAGAGVEAGIASVLKWEDASAGSRLWRRPGEAMVDHGARMGGTHSTQG